MDPKPFKPFWLWALFPRDASQGDMPQVEVLCVFTRGGHLYLCRQETLEEATRLLLARQEAINLLPPDQEKVVGESPAYADRFLLASKLWAGSTDFHTRRLTYTDPKGHVEFHVFTTRGMAWPDIRSAFEEAVVAIQEAGRWRRPSYEELLALREETDLPKR